MAFPTSPINGQQANINGITYTYSSALTAWTVSTSVSNSFVSISVSGNVNSGNVLATGLASVTGNITGGNLSGTNIVGTLTTAAQTNITSVGTLSSLTVTANTTSGNLLTGGLISATGNITGGNILGGANVNATTHTGTTVSVTANVTGGNLLTAGLISSTGNINGGNVTATTGLTAGTLSLTGNTISSTDSIITIDPASAGSSGAVFIQGNLSVTGNVTYINSNNVTTNDLTINMANNAATAAAANGGGIEVGPAGAQYASITYNSSGNIWVVSNGANVSGAASVTGNVTGGNILTGGLISATGNISANNATFTSNQTLSYGTANGVLYLNSNKVATGSTVLQFDGTNLGLGTTSPSTGKFSDASYAVLVQSASTSTGTNIFSSNSDNSKFVGLWSGHSSANSAVGVKSGTALTFGAWSAITGVGGFTEWARFDSSGNLGLTTSGYTLGSLLQLGRVFSFAQDINSGYLGAGWVGGSAPNYAVTGNYAVREYFDSSLGTIVWQTAGTGTAGNPVTFGTKMTLDNSGNLSVVGDVIGYASSDKKFKTNIRPIPNALSAVEHIGGKLFDWTDEYMESVGNADGYFRQKEDFGIVAQDVLKVFPLAVRTRPDGSLAVDYVKLSALAFASIAELSAKLKDLEGKINDLTSRT